MKRLLLACSTLCALWLPGGRAQANPVPVPPTFMPMGPRGLTLMPPWTDQAPRRNSVLEDIYVVPMRPGQNVVPYWEYDWHTWEFTTERGGGGVRLYFYDREREAASYATAALQREYVRLTDVFHYLPRSTIPFILFASYPEFLATNVFFVSEGTLGVTDTRDLRMAVPFFGDVHYFTRVATHEMAHQLTLQKLRDVCLGARVEPPLSLIPLWYIEGLAEWATFGGMDPEGDHIVRDLITNPNPDEGYVLPDFFDERAGGYIGVYKLGQARVTFIEEVYGKGKVVETLERMALLAGAAPRRGYAQRGPDGIGPADSRVPPEDEHRPPPEQEPQEKEASSPPPDDQGLPPDARVNAERNPAPPRPRNFQDYLAIVLGQSPQQIRERYQEWLKERYFRDWLKAQQQVSDFVQYKALAGETDSISVSDDGHLLLYRTVERDTGLSALHLQDLRDPSSRVTVARDQRPGVESLHPVDRRVTALRGQTLAFAARSKENDHLYVVNIRRRERIEGSRVRVELDLGKRREIDVGEVLEIYDPAISPDEKSVAFAGVAPDGFRDLYVLHLQEEGEHRLERLTRDVWSESDVAWDGENGRLLYASDRTETHRLNIFAFDLASRQSTRLTFHADDDRDPVAALGGVVFRGLRANKPDLWLLKDGVERRLTDTSAAMLGGAPTTGDALLAVAFYGGSHRLYRIPQEAFLDEDPDDAPGVGGNSGVALVGTGMVTSHGIDYPRTPIPADTPSYDPGSPGNWRLEASAGALVGPVSVGAAGLAVTDMMRDHLVLINLAVYGSFKLTDASVFYINQARRPQLGIGAFHTFEPLRDKTFPGVDNYYLQREFGVAGLVRHPIDRFRRVEASLELRGIERFSFTDYTGDLYDRWRQLNGGVEPEVVASAAFGYDTTRLHWRAGPVAGSSLLASVSGGWLPVRETGYVRFMADAQHRFQLFGRTHLMLRAAAGISSGGRFSPLFFLFSTDNMEGYRFGDTRLLGDRFYVANARLILPVDWMVNAPFLSGLYAVTGFDFGSAFDRWRDAWPERSLSYVLGTDLAMGGLVFQLHWGKLIGIKSRNGPEGWVFNLNIKYLYF